jgi:hypothetical protein
MEQDFVGTKRWIRSATPYEVYMKEQNLPIHRGTVGFYDIRDLTLGSWKCTGAQGVFIELNGCGGLQGVYVIEVPGACFLPADCLQKPACHHKSVRRRPASQFL